jgi:serine/threonine protein kinase/Tfp pilus assembly protein PilF
MKTERWQQINDLFQSAAERAPDERAAFLDEACHGDERLCRDVKLLIASYEETENFIEAPAFEEAPELLTNDRTGALVGELMGHYRIESLVGVGGMGEVYLARDDRLGRKVALKLLPQHLTTDETQLSRFKTEARTASALNHPNILTVYEIGAEGDRQFIATEFIEGVTLRESLTRGRMDLHDALEIAMQVASALAAAHETGIVHRDIKPENIMLRPDGYAKVLDFGIAKLALQQPAPDSPDVGTGAGLQTQSNLVVGTARYMSPEQMRGQQSDARSDIWSLGVVLYEMVAGIPPFSDATTSDCIASIRKTEPAPLSGVLADVPVKLQSIVQKSLRKNRDERYQTTRELLADLRNLKRELDADSSSPQTEANPTVSKIKRHKRGALLTLAAAMLVAAVFAYRFYVVAPAQLPSEKSIAVLPFADLSPARDQEYFCDGIQEEILTRLSSIAGLRVISRTSTQRFQSKAGNLSEIARQLGVAHVLEGSVQKAADQVRVSVQLINAQTDSHLWADTYDRKLTDIFGVESEIAKRIAESLHAKLTGREEQALAVKPTNDSEAYDAYLRGLAFEARSRHALLIPDLARKAIVFYERSVHLDPKFAIAWARLSRVDAFLYFNREDATLSARGQAAKHALENAQKLEPDSPETLLALGYYQYLVLNDFGLAKTTFRRVMKTLPGNSDVPTALGRVTRREGHWDQSIAYFEQALALDPCNVELLSDTAWTYLLRRQFSAALKLYDRALDIAPNDPDVLAVRASIYQGQGNLQEAARFLSAINEHTPSEGSVRIKITQLRLERNYAEAVRLLQARLAQFHFASQYDKGCDQVALAFAQRVAGDTAGAKVTAEQARNTLERLYKVQPDNALIAAYLSQAYAAIWEKDLALKAAEHAIVLLPRANDAVQGPAMEENLALIQTIFGENSRAISTLSQLLQVPGDSLVYGPNGPAPVTLSLLRLDPIWDPLRADPRFERLVAKVVGGG